MWRHSWAQLSIVGTQPRPRKNSAVAKSLNPDWEPTCNKWWLTQKEWMVRYNQTKGWMKYKQQNTKNQGNKEVVLREKKKKRLTNKYLAKLNKRQKIQINKIRDERGHITTDTKEIQRLLRINFNNLYRTGKPKRNRWIWYIQSTKFNQDQISNSNRPITPSETKTIIKRLPTKQWQKNQNETKNKTQKSQTDSAQNSTWPLKKN